MEMRSQLPAAAFHQTCRGSLRPIAVIGSGCECADMRNATSPKSGALLSHRQRAKQILASHPDVRNFFYRDQWSALWTVLLAVLQVATGVGLRT